MNEELLEFEIAKAETLKRRRFNPFRKIMGKAPTEVEMASWSHDRWMDFLQFVVIFIEKNETEAFKFTNEKRAFLESFLDIPSHPFHEFIYRVDKWNGEHADKDYRFRFQAIVRITLTYLKTHPSLINSDMKILIDAYPKRLGWVLKQYKEVETGMGSVLQRDDSTDNGTTVKLPSLQSKMMNSLVVMTDMYENIAMSIRDKDIKEMKLSEKLKALKDLSFIFTTASKRQATNHLTQININTKDAKGAEESMLDYLKKSQEK